MVRTSSFIFYLTSALSLKESTTYDAFLYAFLPAFYCMYRKPPKERHWALLNLLVLCHSPRSPSLSTSLLRVTTRPLAGQVDAGAALQQRVQGGATDGAGCCEAGEQPSQAAVQQPSWRQPTHRVFAVRQLARPPQHWRHQKSRGLLFVSLRSRVIVVRSRRAKPSR